MQLILVNENDDPVGFMEKMEVHEKGLLHRAFSIFIFNQKGEMLLQKRAKNKYHSGGLWTNACCSHPLLGEATEPAAHRRLKEEMGFDTVLNKSFSFVYKVHFGNGLTEYEFDHVFTGKYDGEIRPVAEEVSEYKYVPVAELLDDLQQNPQNYTAWFQIAIPKLMEYLA
ncbi:MAG: isopentenyl-diphosphate Delta-isomerase [Ferruginibacter sp.]